MDNGCHLRIMTLFTTAINNSLSSKLMIGQAGNIHIKEGPMIRKIDRDLNHQDA